MVVPDGSAAALLDDARQLIAAIRSAPAVMFQLGDEALVEMGQVALALTRAGEALAVAATTEAVSRGVVRESSAASVTHWVRDLGPGIEPTQAHRIAAVADDLAAGSSLVPFHGGPLLAEQAEPSNTSDEPVDPDVDVLVAADPSGRALLAEALRAGVLNVRAAAMALKEAPRMQALLPTASRAEVLSWFVALGDEATDRDRRALSRQLIARFEPGDLDRSEAAAQQRETLSFQHLPSGLVRLIAELSPGNAAIVQQAIGHLAAPRPSQAGSSEADASEPDSRTPGKRRADALLELIDKATRQLPRAQPGSVTGQAKAVVMVDLQTLQADSDSDRRLQPSQRQRPKSAAFLPGTGQTLAGDLLAPMTLRRLACDAGVIPAVLGKDGSVLDVGREERLFSGRLRTAVVVRDRWCTFPGCDRPPDWCEVHHLVPWWAGGETSLSNGALLCARHHTVVHRDGLHGEVRDNKVAWDRRPGRMADRWARTA